MDLPIAVLLSVIFRYCAKVEDALWPSKSREAAPPQVQAALFEAEADQMENPIRRIVTLLQKMQGEIAAESARDEELMEKSALFFSWLFCDIRQKT